MRARLLGLAGVAVAAGATGWAFAGGAGAPVVTLVLIGWCWRSPMLRSGARLATDRTSTSLPDSGCLLNPGEPWSAVTAAIGLVATVIVEANPAAVVVAIVGAAALVGSFPRHAGSTLASGTGADRSPAPSVRASTRRRGGAAGAGLPHVAGDAWCPAAGRRPRRGVDRRHARRRCRSRSRRWRESNCASRTTHSLRSGYGSGPGHGRG